MTNRGLILVALLTTAENHLEHITEPFYRAEASHTGSTGGFGFGLHLAKLNAKARGGALNITSRIADKVNTVNSGKQIGTVVCVALPKAQFKA